MNVFEHLLASYEGTRLQDLARALDDAREAAWAAVRRVWPLHVRRIASEARPSPQSQIVAEGDRLGWTAWGDQARSRQRLDAAQASFTSEREQIMRDEVSATLRGRR